jgi:hypothetical protein
MDEQRILEEMERNLAADDPRLASRLSAFGQQGMHSPILSGRAKAISGVVALTLVVAVTLVLFVLSPFARQHYMPPRTHTSATPPATQTTSSSGN